MSAAGKAYCQGFDARDTRRGDNHASAYSRHSISLGAAPLRQHLVAEAEAGVVVYEADGLHKGVDGDGAEELEASFLEFGGYAVGKLRPRRRSPLVGLGVVRIVQRLAVREGPEPLGEGAVFAAEFDEAFGVVDDGLDLPARADHARHGEDARDVAFAVVGDLLEIKVLEGDAEGVAFQENGVPAQTALQHFVHEVLEKLAVVPARRPPFLVVVDSLLVVQFKIGTADFLVHTGDTPRENGRRFLSCAGKYILKKKFRCDRGEHRDTVDNWDIPKTILHLTCGVV